MGPSNPTEPEKKHEISQPMPSQTPTITDDKINDLSKIVGNKVAPISANVVDDLTKSPDVYDEEDLDLTDEKEYTSIVEKLDELKATWIKSAEEDLSKIKTQGNVVVEDRLAILRNLLLALQLDNKELLTISEATQADSSFEEDLKEEETNRAAANEYQKQADEEFEKQMNTLPAPYCATY